MRRLEVGRAVGLAIFGLFAVGAGVRFMAHVRASVAGDPSLEAVHAGLVLAFYILLLSAYAFRTPARAGSISSVPKAVAIAATFLPLLLPPFTGEGQVQALLAIGVVLGLAGMTFACWSVLHLRRSFSIVPQARDLVDTGPYRLVRHPLYTGELVALAGIVLSGPTLAAGFLLVLLCLLQAYRATQEEALLAEALPGYEDYQRRTARLVPAVW